MTFTTKMRGYAPRKLPANTREIFLDRLTTAVTAAVLPMVSEVMENTEFSSVRDKYSLEPFKTAFTAGVIISNSSSAWKWTEVSAQSHWPPYGENSRIAFWVIGKFNYVTGEPLRPYTVAKAVHRDGTIGGYAFTNAKAQHKERIKSEIAAASRQILADLLRESIQPIGDL